jgi:hypothetical protein
MPRGHCTLLLYASAVENELSVGYLCLSFGNSQETTNGQGVASSSEGQMPVT